MEKEKEKVKERKREIDLRECPQVFHILLSFHIIYSWRHASSVLFFLRRNSLILQITTLIFKNAILILQIYCYTPYIVVDLVFCILIFKNKKKISEQVGRRNYMM